MNWREELVRIPNQPGKEETPGRLPLFLLVLRKENNR